MRLNKLYELEKQATEFPLEIGDTILVGKYRNQRILIKEFGTDENGQPTINGKRKVFGFRINKLMPKNKRQKDLVPKEKKKLHFNV